MTALTQKQVREFLLNRYAGALAGMGLKPTGIPDTFDFLTNGVIDSFGVLEMIAAIEEAFEVQVDRRDVGCRAGYDSRTAFAAHRSEQQAW